MWTWPVCGTCVVGAVDDRSHRETQWDAELGSRRTTTSWKETQNGPFLNPCEKAHENQNTEPCVHTHSIHRHIPVRNLVYTGPYLSLTNILTNMRLFIFRKNHLKKKKTEIFPLVKADIFSFFSRIRSARAASKLHPPYNTTLQQYLLNPTEI